MTAGEVWGVVILGASAAVVVLLELAILGRLHKVERQVSAGLHRMAAIMSSVQDLGGGSDLPRPAVDGAPELELDDVGNAAARDPRA